jgi:hypothetical protein
MPHRQLELESGCKNLKDIYKKLLMMYYYECKNSIKKLEEHDFKYVN